MPQDDYLYVVLIEDDLKTRLGVQMLFSGTSGFGCLAGFASMEDALAEPWSTVPNAILADIGLPGMSGIKGFPLLRERYPDSIILAFTVYEDDERLFAALRAGASGYLLKSTPPAQLLESVREAVRGGAPISPQLARKVVNFFQRNAAHDLTHYELKVLELLVEGHSYKTAAKELKVTPDTVAFHVKRIYVKLHVHSKSQAVALALKAGIVG